MKQRYGWRPSLPDHRDLVADPAGVKILPEVDPRNELPPVYDQGQLGSCTANAVAAAIEYDARLGGRDIGGTPSRLDIYWQERQLEHEPAGQDTGAYGRDGFRAAHGTGTIPEKAWPYDVAKFSTAPPHLVAQRHKIGAYKSVLRLTSAFKQVLSNRQTIAFGFTVYESFEGADVAKTGLVPVPTKAEQVLGGHEMLLVGYLKSEPKYAIGRNSWGTGWGLSGYCLFPWAILLNPGMSSDFRTISRPVGK